ncbi:hypothetical protein SNEBB_001467 [Seison nebaliae]|nr:hypothetical protein SNEBB_001467 [Seison nebaliae]
MNSQLSSRKIREIEKLLRAIDNNENNSKTGMRMMFDWMKKNNNHRKEKLMKEIESNLMKRQLLKTNNKSRIIQHFTPEQWKDNSINYQQLRHLISSIMMSEADNKKVKKEELLLYMKKNLSNEKRSLKYLNDAQEISWNDINGILSKLRTNQLTKQRKLDTRERKGKFKMTEILPPIIRSRQSSASSIKSNKSNINFQYLTKKHGHLRIDSSKVGNRLTKSEPLFYPPNFVQQKSDLLKNLLDDEARVAKKLKKRGRKKLNYCTIHYDLRDICNKQHVSRLESQLNIWERNSKVYSVPSVKSRRNQIRTPDYVKRIDTLNSFATIGEVNGKKISGPSTSTVPLSIHLKIKSRS